MRSLLLVISILYSAIGYTQDANIPRPSPKASVSQTIGVADVVVNYCRPSARDRKVFGGLVPLGKVWRAGANEATTISFSYSVKFGPSPK